MRFISTVLIPCGRLFCSMNLALPGHAGSCGWVMPMPLRAGGKEALLLPISDDEIFLQQHNIAPLGLTWHKHIVLVIENLHLFSSRWFLVTKVILFAAKGPVNVKTKLGILWQAASRSMVLSRQST